MMRLTITVNGGITINIPGLPELVAYLDGRQQAEVDAMAAAVAAGTKTLSDSAAGLKAATPTVG